MFLITEKAKAKLSWFRWHIHTFRCYPGEEDQIGALADENTPIPIPEDYPDVDTGGSDEDGQRKEAQDEAGTNKAKSTSSTTSLIQKLLCFTAIVFWGTTSG